MNEEKIDDLIKESYIDPKGLCEPILDGIVDEKEFKKAKLKILWILKEPYDEIDEQGNPIGGGWDKREDLRKKDEFNYFQKDHGTFDAMIYIAYCVLNGFVLYSDHKVNYIKDDPSMISYLKKIAYININKLPAYTESNGREAFLKETCGKFGYVLDKQIEYINPDIIIGGNTLQYLYEHWKINTKVKAIEGFNMNYYQTKSKIYINTYHPAYFLKMKKVDRADYLDAIIKTLKSWDVNR